MKLSGWITKNQFRKLNRLIFIEKSNVNERLKEILKKKWKVSET